MSREFKMMLIVGFSSLLFISAAIINSPTTRSTNQIVLYSTSVPILYNQINEYYKMGYRVIHIESQSVAIAIGQETRSKELKGEIIVIMEK